MREQLRSVIHLQLILVLELETLLELLFDGRFQVVEIALGLDLVLGLYMNRKLDFHNLYTHSFSIIGVLWLLRLNEDHLLHLLDKEFEGMGEQSKLGLQQAELFIQFQFLENLRCICW